MKSGQRAANGEQESSAVSSQAMDFRILGEIRQVEIIASGSRIKILPRLIRLYGRGNWLKMKGIARVQLDDGTISEAEVHWFEAEGIGKRKMKIKWLLS